VYEDEGDLVLGTKVGQPVPGEDAFDTDDDIFTQRFDGFEKRLWLGLHVFVQDNFPFTVLDTEVHRSGVQVDAAIVLMGVGEESHWVSSFSESDWLHLVAYRRVRLWRRPQ